ncbi:MAG: transposase domain-containing protein [Oscillospiraceae bacterium]|nr:transposase domain-containing protein [Oscillospiraceae bacterium]
MAYSIIQTAIINGLNPYQYLRFLLEKLPTATTAD